MSSISDEAQQHIWSLQERDSDGDKATIEILRAMTAELERAHTEFAKLEAAATNARFKETKAALEPTSINEAQCKSCNAAVLWATTVAGKPMILDATAERRIALHPRTKRAHVINVYVAHWATCPDSDQHRKP